MVINDIGDGKIHVDEPTNYHPKKLKDSDKLIILKLWVANSRIPEHLLIDYGWVNFEDLSMLMGIVDDCLRKYDLDFRLYTDDGYYFAQFTKRMSDKDMGHSCIGQLKPTDAIKLALLTLASFKNIKENTK